MVCSITASIYVAFVFGVEITSTVAAIDPKLYFHCGKFDDFFYTIIRKRRKPKK